LHRLYESKFSKTNIKMKELATYLMLQIGGNATPSKDDVTGALSAVGVESDSASLDKLYADLEGKEISELIEEGKKQLAKFGGGGGGGGGGGAVAAEAEVVEEEEEEEEAEAPSGGGLFGGDEGGGDY
jgi:large subunit ribosomal protein LP2